MPDFRDYEDVVFIAGQNFQSEFGEHLAGTEVEEARNFSNLQVLIDAHYIYPVAPEAGYNFLPPHLFNHINVKDEVMAKLRGVLSPNPDHFQDGKKPESLLLAEREARQKLTEMNGDTKEAKEAAKEARKTAAAQYQSLQTVDANPNLRDKGSDLTKTYKGDKTAWEVMQEQGDEVQKAKDAEPMKEEEMPVILKKDAKTDEKALPKEENPDLKESKKPVDNTDLPADAVGKQPSNVAKGGSRPANAAAAAAEKKS